MLIEKKVKPKNSSGNKNLLFFNHMTSLMILVSDP